MCVCCVNGGVCTYVFPSILFLIIKDSVKLHECASAAAAAAAAVAVYRYGGDSSERMRHQRSFDNGSPPKKRPKVKMI